MVTMHGAPTPGLLRVPRPVQRTWVPLTLWVLAFNVFSFSKMRTLTGNVDALECRRSSKIVHFGDFFALRQNAQGRRTRHADGHRRATAGYAHRRGSGRMMWRLSFMAWRAYCWAREPATLGCSRACLEGGNLRRPDATPGSVAMPATIPVTVRESWPAGRAAALPGSVLIGLRSSGNAAE